MLVCSFLDRDELLAHLLLFLAKRQAWGWFAFGGLVFLAILSLPPIRRSSYTLFWHAHWIGFFMFTVAVSTFLHANTCIPSDVPAYFFSPAIMRRLASLTASLDSLSTGLIRSLGSSSQMLRLPQLLLSQLLNAPRYAPIHGFLFGFNLMFSTAFGPSLDPGLACGPTCPCSCFEFRHWTLGLG